MDSELSAVPIRFFLFADVLADLLPLESDGGYGANTTWYLQSHREWDRL
jgi:hypothetical protein